MFFDFAEIAPKYCYKLIVSTVTPRPIAWVVSQDAAGVLNAAPFSFFNAFASDPPIIGIGIAGRSRRPAPGAEATDNPLPHKDTRSNIAAVGEFVVNLVSEETVQAMSITAIDFDPHIDELAQAGLTAHPSVRVKPPRIAESPVAMECVLHQIVDFNATNSLVLGRIVAMHVRDDVVLDAATALIDTSKLHLIGRMHGTSWYARTTDLFELVRNPAPSTNR
jgi:flavin reductase (DIM6/NTAB) family NADH-FMN oxidoreductase RutF